MATEQQGLLPSDWEIIIPFFHQDLDLELAADRAKVTRSYLVPAGQGGFFYLQGLLARWLGNPFMGTVNGLPTMFRHLPETIEVMTDDEDNGYMFATSIKVTGLGGGGEQDEHMPFEQPYRAWTYFLVTVTYTTEEYNVRSYDQIDEDFDNETYFPGGPDQFGLGLITQFTAEIFRYVTWNDDQKNEMAVADNAAWVIINDPSIDTNNWEAFLGKYGGTSFPVGTILNDVGNKLGLPVPSGELELTWFDVHPLAFDPVNARALEGTTNAFPFLDYDPGTLVFNGFSRRWKRSPLGQRLVNIQMRFLIRAAGANSTIKRDGSGFTIICYRNNPSKHPLKIADFNTLFQPNPNGSPFVALYS